MLVSMRYAYCVPAELVLSTVYPLGVAVAEPPRRSNTRITAFRAAVGVKLAVVGVVLLPLAPVTEPSIVSALFHSVTLICGENVPDGGLITTEVLAPDPTAPTQR